MKYALIKDNIVIEIAEDVSLAKYKQYLVVDISELLPEPQIGWVLNGNILEKPIIPEVDKTDLVLDMRFKFGNKLADTMVKKMSKANLKLIAQGQTLNINTVISNFVGVEAALRKCAIPTAKAAISSLLVAYPEYTEEFNFAIAEINNFLSYESTL